jgi:hypothetical protein
MPNDPGYRRLRYVRYADDFLLGFAGPKGEAEEIRQRLGEFLEQKLKLTLSVEKTLITHATDDKAKFLGYEVTVSRQEDLLSENRLRTTNGRVALLMPQKVVHKYHKMYSRKGKVVHRRELTQDTDYTILQRYQGILRGVYNYYCMATNVSRRMRYIKWVLEKSLTKTLANKYRCKVTDIYKKYRAEILGYRVLRVIVERPGKEPLVAVFGGIPFEKRLDGMGEGMDFCHATVWMKHTSKRSEVVQRLLTGRCELCGVEGVPMEVHHIRKLSDIDRPGRRPKANWEKWMAARQRKTLVVCKGCHYDITAGRHDGPSTRE